MSENEEARQLANRLLDEPNADPDDDLRILSRQLLRADEEVARLRLELQRSETKRDGLRAEVERLKCEAGAPETSHLSSGTFRACGKPVKGHDHTEPCALTEGHSGRCMWGRGD